MAVPDPVDGPAGYDVYWLVILGAVLALVIAATIALMIIAIVVVARSEITGTAAVLLILLSIVFTALGSIIAIIVVRMKQSSARPRPGGEPGTPDRVAPQV